MKIYKREYNPWQKEKSRSSKKKSYVHSAPKKKNRPRMRNQTYRNPVHEKMSSSVMSDHPKQDLHSPGVFQGTSSGAGRLRKMNTPDRSGMTQRSGAAIGSGSTTKSGSGARSSARSGALTGFGSVQKTTGVTERNSLCQDAAKKYGWTTGTKQENAAQVQSSGFTGAKIPDENPIVKGAEIIPADPYTTAARVVKETVQKGKSYISQNLGNKKQEADTTKDPFRGVTGFLVKLTAGFMLLLFLLLSPLVMVIMTVSSVAGTVYYQQSQQEVIIVDIAEQELAVASENVGGQKYKDWYGIDGDWCAMFVSWCSQCAGYIDQGIMPKSASVSVMSSWYKEHGLWQEKADGYEPKAGDIVFFQNGMSHVGIVTEYDPQTKVLTTIEGNTGGSVTAVYHKGSRVCQKQYPLSYSKISGYGTPEY